MSEDKSADASRTGMRRRQDTLFFTLRRFGRLWGFLAFLILIVLLFRGVVLPFIFGLLIAYLLAPVVARLQPKIGRVLAVILCYVILLGALGAFFGFLLPAVAKDLARLRDAARPPSSGSTRSGSPRRRRGRTSTSATSCPRRRRPRRPSCRRRSWW